MTPTQRIVKWNEGRGLLEQGYNAERESAFILEELYELLGFKGDVKGYARRMATNLIIADNLRWRAGSIYKHIRKHEPTDQDILDGLGDLIVFATGAMAKKLYEMKSDKNVDDILNSIMDKNDLKGKKVDKAGKIIKSDDFEQPKLA